MFWIIIAAIIVAVGIVMFISDKVQGKISVFDVVICSLGTAFACFLLAIVVPLIISREVTMNTADVNYEHEETIHITMMPDVDGNDTYLRLIPVEGKWYYEYAEVIGAEYTTVALKTIAAENTLFVYIDDSETPRIEKQVAVWANPDVVFLFNLDITPDRYRYVAYVPESMVYNIAKHEQAIQMLPVTDAP